MTASTVLHAGVVALVTLALVAGVLGLAYALTAAGFAVLGSRPVLSGPISESCTRVLMWTEEV